MINQANRVIDLKRLRNFRTKSEDDGKVWALTSGKGGTGKSFVSLNLSLKLAEFGQKVLCVDLDFNLSNLNILLNLSPENTIGKFFSNRILFDDLIFSYNENLDLIFGDSGEPGFEVIDTSKIEILMRKIKGVSKRYDYIIIDTSSGASEIVMKSLEMSDNILIIATPEPTSVMDSYALTKLMIKNGIEKNPSLLVNKCQSEEDAKTAYQNLKTASEHFLGKKVEYFGFIEFHNDAYQSTLQQKNIVENFKESILDKRLAGLVKKLTKKHSIG